MQVTVKDLEEFIEAGIAEGKDVSELKKKLEQLKNSPDQAEHAKHKAKPHKGKWVYRSTGPPVSEQDFT